MELDPTVAGLLPDSAIPTTFKRHDAVPRRAW